MFKAASELVASCGVTWQCGAGGRQLTSALRSVTLELAFPDEFGAPGPDGAPAMRQLTSAVHVRSGEEPNRQPIQLAMWTRDNEEDQLVFRLPSAVGKDSGPGAGDVLLVKHLVYDPSDPRVELSTGGSVLTTQSRVPIGPVTIDETPVETIVVTFSLDELPPGATLALSVQLAGVKRSLELDEGATEAVLELFSDKYAEIDHLDYTTTLTVNGPGMSDAPLDIPSLRSIAVPLPRGLFRTVHAALTLPPIPADKLEQANRYFAGNRGD